MLLACMIFVRLTVPDRYRGSSFVCLFYFFAIRVCSESFLDCLPVSAYSLLQPYASQVQRNLNKPQRGRDCWITTAKLVASLIYGHNLDQRYMPWNNRRSILFRSYSNNYAAPKLTTLIRILLHSKSFYFVEMKTSSARYHALPAWHCWAFANLSIQVNSK